MKVLKIRWTRDRKAHIARHNLVPEEVEEAVYDDPHALVEVLKKAAQYPGEKIYRCLAVTETGRYITFNLSLQRRWHCFSYYCQRDDHSGKETLS